MHLATTRHLRCWEQLSLRCSLDADASGVSGKRPRGSYQLHHCGDVGQLGAPPACGAGVSRFDPDTSHRIVFLDKHRPQEVYGPCWVEALCLFKPYRVNYRNKHYLQDNLRTLLGPVIQRQRFASSINLRLVSVTRLVHLRRDRWRLACFLKPPMVENYTNYRFKFLSIPKKKL